MGNGLIELLGDYKDFTVIPRSHEMEVIEVAVEAIVGKPFKLTFTRPSDGMMPKWKFTVSFSSVMGEALPGIIPRSLEFEENEMSVSALIAVDEYMDVIKYDSFKVKVKDGGHVIKETDVTPTMPIVALDVKFKHQPRRAVMLPIKYLVPTMETALLKSIPMTTFSWRLP